MSAGWNETDRDIVRTKRVKEARDEAKKEIDAYRKEKEDEFKKFEAEVCYAWESRGNLVGKRTEVLTYWIAHKWQQESRGGCQ